MKILIAYMTGEVHENPDSKLAAPLARNFGDLVVPMAP
jgi:hypothetical protein